MKGMNRERREKGMRSKGKILNRGSSKGLKTKRRKKRKREIGIRVVNDIVRKCERKKGSFERRGGNGRDSK